MRRYGSKRSSRPYARTHKVCSICDGYNQTRIKARRAIEARREKEEIQSQLDEGE